MFRNLIEDILNFTSFGSYSKTGRKDFALVDDMTAKIKRQKQTDAVDEKAKKVNSLILALSVVVCVLVLFTRSFFVQVLQRRVYGEYARENIIRKEVLEAERGVIYDRRGRVLVRNVPSFSLEMDLMGCASLGGLPACEQVIKKLSFVSDFDVSRVLALVKSKQPNIVVAANLKKEDILTIEANLAEYPGLYVAVVPQREYPYADVFTHVLGYVGISDFGNRIYEGKSGIEMYYNKFLAGVPGERIVYVDSLQKKYDLMAQKLPFPGKNIYTNLYYEIQLKAYEGLKKAVDAKKATGGAIVAQDPKTGGVIALVSYPSFDPNSISRLFEELSRNAGLPFFNRAVSGVYPPGSVFKMVTASAALMTGAVTEHTTIFDNGYISVGGQTFKNWNVNGQGVVDLRRALQVSNDTYFYEVGGGYGDISGVGISRLSDWAKKFGFASLTGVDIDGEEKGFVPDGTGRKWYLGDTYITSIGQGDMLTTPIQINNMVSYFAVGRQFVPSVVKSVEGVGDSKLITISEGMLDRDYFEAIREGMKMAVLPGGTAYPLFDFPIRHPGIYLAGKTGTAEFIDKDGKPGTHAWFTVFGPFNDPSIVVTVFLENGGSGSDDAAPIAREILDEWFK